MLLSGCQVACPSHVEQSSYTLCQRRITITATIVTVLLHVRAHGEPSLLAMAHMRWYHGQSGRLSTDCTVVCSIASVGCWPGPQIGGLNKGCGQK